MALQTSRMFARALAFRKSYLSRAHLAAKIDEAVKHLSDQNARLAMDVAN